MVSAAEDGDFLGLSDPADAVPAVLTELGEVLHALEVDGNIGSLLMGSLLADGQGLVDIIDAFDFLGVGAVVVHLEGEGKGNQHQKHEDSHL